MPDKASLATLAEFEEFCAGAADFLQVYDFQAERIEYGEATVRLPYDRKHVRPGETMSGPSMMALGDYALWVAVVGAYGVMAKMAVTTGLNVNFLRAAGLNDLICEARVLKPGKRLAVGEGTVYAEGVEGPVAHVTATYSIPPAKSGT
ncbi:MAG: hotdog fold thioesterase [Alphaproteobacteria bacterium]|nr:hotdog fold thioesterase [Alphaproteobacteria bacterium]